jgi:formylglycine-generating enzyme required for sulfatase activity
MTKGKSDRLSSRLPRSIPAGLAAASLVCLATCAGRPEPGTVERDERTGLSWVYLRGGGFTLGSVEDRGTKREKPPVLVTLQDFSLTLSEVTVEQYGRCVRAGKCRLRPATDKVLPPTCNLDRGDRLDHPMNCVDWQMAADYCAFAEGRLPSESEWEYAARGMGQDREYPWGDDPATCERAHLSQDESKTRCEPRGTVPVCSKPTGNTPQGLCDMAGNVLEWLADWHADGYLKHPRDGSPRTEVKRREFRGMRGGGIGSEESCRARNRVFHDPPFFYGGLGIRCARNAAGRQK